MLLARACATAARKNEGSMVAMVCPVFTEEPKSANSVPTRPETWLPTRTVTSGYTVPVAVTLAAMGPRFTVAVS
jgi:hypothetical protein